MIPKTSQSVKVLRRQNLVSYFDIIIRYSFDFKWTLLFICDEIFA